MVTAIDERGKIMVVSVEGTAILEYGELPKLMQELNEIWKVHETEITTSEAKRRHKTPR